MSARLQSHFRSLLELGACDVIAPDEARELIEIALAQDRVIRYLAETVKALKPNVEAARPRMGLPCGKWGVRWSLPPLPARRMDS